MFSDRIRWELEQNDLSKALGEKRAAGEAILDLTVSNPTRAELAYPAEAILASLASEKCLVYSPDARGSHDAREAVLRDYRRRGRDHVPADLFLTASTSEAYSYLFKLLCEPGAEVLVPRPSYPLFEFLASLEAVTPVFYPLRYDGTWHIDFPALEAKWSERTRAVVAVHPNNPTGSYVAAADSERLSALAEERGAALVVDEVFLDFPLSPGLVPKSFAGAARGLVFTLGGLSKLAGLPQMKLGWIGVSGAPMLVSEAALRLEHIADTYLSVGAPVQAAASKLLDLASPTTEGIAERCRTNLGMARRSLIEAPSVTALTPEGGWYLPLRLPAVRSADEWALDLLRERSVYLHPGSFFGFETEAVVVASLLTPVPTFREGLLRVLRTVSDRVDSAHE